MNVSPDPDDVLEAVPRVLDLPVGDGRRAARRVRGARRPGRRRAGSTLGAGPRRARAAGPARPGRCSTPAWPTGLAREGGRAVPQLAPGRPVPGRRLGVLAAQLRPRRAVVLGGRGSTSRTPCGPTHQLLPEDAEGYHAFPEDFFLDFLHGHSLAMGERLAGAVDLGGATPDHGRRRRLRRRLHRPVPDRSRRLEAIVVDQPPVAARAAVHIERGRARRAHHHLAGQHLRETRCRRTATSPSWPTSSTTSPPSGPRRSSAGSWPPCPGAGGS